jgi:hypothetical protein
MCYELAAIATFYIELSLKEKRHLTLQKKNLKFSVCTKRSFNTPEELIKKELVHVPNFLHIFLEEIACSKITEAIEIARKGT